MAKIGYIIVCDEVFDNKKGGLTIDLPYAQICPYVIPGQFSFSLSFSVFDIVPNQKHFMHITAHSPSGKQMWDLNADFEFKDNDILQHTIINVPCKNILFEAEGTHVFSININNGESVKILEIPVREFKGEKK